MNISNSVVNVGQQDVQTQGNPAAPATIGQGEPDAGPRSTLGGGDLPSLGSASGSRWPQPLDPVDLDLGPGMSPELASPAGAPPMGDPGLGEAGAGDQGPIDLGPPQLDQAGATPLGPVWSAQEGRYS